MQTTSELRVLPLTPLLQRIGTCITAAGGQALLVGGAVRDMLRGQTPKDLDIEVFGLSEDALVVALGALGDVGVMGRAFRVWQVRGMAADFALPRAPHFEQAVRHRDLTINSMGLDLKDGHLVDPLNGQHDLQHGILRACDARYFGDDALRGLRVAQMMARFDMQPDAELLELCRNLDLSHIAPERMYTEFNKLLLFAAKPSVGLMFLAQTKLLGYFGSLDAMRGVAQDPKWHPEGDVWVHTCMVVDCAAALRDGGEDDLTLMWAALVHDIGKPTTTYIENGRVRSPNHDVAGVAPAKEMLCALKAPNEMTRRVSTLVRHHLAPAMLYAAKASDRAYRRLYRALYAGHVSPALLARLARADQLGRTTPAAKRGEDVASDAFIARIGQLGLDKQPRPDVVQGRDLIAKGIAPGPIFRAILQACRQHQDATGRTDPSGILSDVLKDFPEAL
jgi:tRNA nucleotidyltransferase (CCA-adding enzyme)